jgi:hypothetical protein
VHAGDLIISPWYSSGTAPSLEIRNPANTFGTKLRAQPQTAGIEYYLPIVDGVDQQVLKYNTGGLLSWENIETPSKIQNPDDGLTYVETKNDDTVDVF